MANVKTLSENYESPKTLNVADLDSFSVESEVFEFVGEDEEGKAFKYNYIVVEEENYRIPNSVLKQIKTILKKKPDLEKVSVVKEGEGLKTTYTVIPAN